MADSRWLIADGRWSVSQQSAISHMPSAICKRYRRANVKKYGFVIDPKRCIDCRACLVACRAENNVPLNQTRIWVYDQGVQGSFPNLSQQFVPYNCMHCDEPPCVEACPSQATYKRPEDGLGVIDQQGG